MRAILSNPRYTGRQVWNRQPTDDDLIDPANTGLGHRQIQRWSLPADWVISTRAAHQALTSEADFIAFQGMRAAREDAEHRYLLPGCCDAESAGGALNRAGRTTGPPTAAGTATPAQRAAILTARRTSTYARTGSSPICRP